jgi:hypothetical protein
MLAMQFSCLGQMKLLHLATSYRWRCEGLGHFPFPLIATRIFRFRLCIPAPLQR